MPSRRFDDMSKHDPPGRIQWRINLETGEVEPVPGYDAEAEQRAYFEGRGWGYGRERQDDEPLENPLQERPQPPE